MADSIWGHAGKEENILDFKAGQLFRKGRMIHADPQKGRVVVFHDMNRILHVKWMTRPGKKTKPDEDLMVLPGDCKFVHISKVTDGRVFALEFASGKERFFWLQEPSSERDEDTFEKLSKVVASPEQVEKVSKQQESMIKGYQNRQKEKEKKKKEEEERKNALSEDSFNQALQDVLGGIPAQEQDSNKVMVSFNDVLHSRRVEEILVNDPTICREIVSYLPEGTPATPEGVMKHIRGPQFRQAVDLVYMALYSGQVEGRTLGFDVPHGARTVEDICKKMAKKFDKMEDED